MQRFVAFTAALVLFGFSSAGRASCEELAARLDTLAKAGHQMKQSRLTAETWSAPGLSGFSECRYAERKGGEYSCAGEFFTDRAQAEAAARSHADFIADCTPFGWQGFSGVMPFEWNDKLGLKYSLYAIPTVKVIDGEMTSGLQPTLTVSKHTTSTSAEPKNYNFTERPITCELLKEFENAARTGLAAHKGNMLAPNQWASKFGFFGAEHCEIALLKDEDETAHSLSCESLPYRHRSDVEKTYASLVETLKSCSGADKVTNLTVLEAEPRVAIELAEGVVGIVALQTLISLRWSLTLASL